jgi:hypothetical protein
MQYIDLLSDLRWFSSLPHVRKEFKRVKILSHNSQILSTFVFVKIIHPDIHKLDWESYLTLWSKRNCQTLIAGHQTIVFQISTFSDENSSTFSKNVDNQN